VLSDEFVDHLRPRAATETEHGFLDNLAAPTSMTTRHFAAALAKQATSATA